ncbi:MAG: glycosyltransferase family 2 protein [Anaerolineaceae bacterium]|nr:glycosyltransferase family 2 protein [Anaerolineaceae bacterium]
MAKSTPEPQLSVIVPVFNEERTILNVLEALEKALPKGYEIIVVDDGSADGTTAIVEKYAGKHKSVRLIRHPQNRGKTAALVTGFAASTGQIVIVQDADLEYDPAEIADVIAPILSNRADVVYGSRFLTRRASRVLYYRHYLANRFLTGLSNLLTDLNFTDVETCYKAFRGEIIRNMVITSQRFGFEVEVTAKIAKLSCRTYEVPISYYGRTYQEGKKIGFKDGVQALWYILKYNLFTSLKASYRKIPKLDM